jgi:uncharacterized protein YwqG
VPSVRIPASPPDEVEPLPLDGEKLEGWPRWIQASNTRHAPNRQPDEAGLQVDSQRTLPTMWGDAGIGHVTQCPNRADVLTFAWDCS